MPKPPQSAPAGAPPRLAVLHRYAGWISVALVLLGTARIAATWFVLSHTVDEPAHIACGMEYLDRGVYRLEPQHPPLTRAAVALLPRLAGARSQGLTGIWDEGLAILGSGAAFERNLTLARAGNLPFFWLAAALVFLFARRITGSPAAAAGAVFLFSFTPTVLAHAGVATTDMGFTALFLAAAYAGWRWLENPDPRRTALLGLAIGGAVLAKFSTLAFYPMTAALAVPGFWYFRRADFRANLRRYAAGLPAALLLAAVVIWAAYRFSWGPPPGWSFAVPAPELFAGIDQVRHHDRAGHLTYLLGRVNTVGWWYFYVVALAVKTPLPLLAAGLGGLLLLSTRRFAAQGWILPALVIGVLGYASLFSNIVIGTRHVLPVYAALAIAGAAGAAWLLERFPGRRRGYRRRGRGPVAGGRVRGGASGLPRLLQPRRRRPPRGVSGRLGPRLGPGREAPGRAPPGAGRHRSRVQSVRARQPAGAVRHAADERNHRGRPRARLDRRRRHAHEARPLRGRPLCLRPGHPVLAGADPAGGARGVRNSAVLPPSLVESPDASFFPGQRAVAVGDVRSRPAEL